MAEQDSGFENPYAYTARERDKESGLYYYRARYYDAQRGSFIEEDPIGLLGGINMYAYASNNPVMYVDPSGLNGYMGLGFPSSSILNEAISEGPTVVEAAKQGATVAAVVIVSVAAAPAMAAGSSAVAKAPSLMCSAVEIGVVTSPIWGNPAAQQGVIDFSQGLLTSGPPPMSPAGVAGSATAAIIDVITNGQ